MDLGLRLVGILVTVGMASLGSWIYRFPDQFLKLMFGDLMSWGSPPVRLARFFGLVLFCVGSYSLFRGFVPETFTTAHRFAVITADIAFTIIIGTLLNMRYPQKSSTKL